MKRYGTPSIFNMVSLSVKVCFFAILCTVVGVIIKHLRPEFSPFVRIAGSAAVSLLAISIILPIITFLRSLFDGSSIGEYGSAVIKALGIAALTQICADICRDSGEGSAASGVELIGKLEILLLCIPMIEDILTTVREVMSWS